MKGILSVCSLLFLQASISYAAPEFTPFIFGGSDVTTTDDLAKSTVGLKGSIPGQGSYICTGTLIANDLVMTAAHCVIDDHGQPIGHLDVLFGTDMQSAQVDIPSDASRANPNYQQVEVDANDIALVHFTGGLPNGYVTANLPSEDLHLSSGQKLVAAGFGISDPTESFWGGAQGSGVLRTTSETIDKPNYGRSEFSIAPSSSSGDCFGDSGGPFYLNHTAPLTVVGVVSRGVSEDCRDGGVHTLVSAQLSWIKQTSTQLRRISARLGKKRH